MNDRQSKKAIIENRKNNHLNTAAQSPVEQINLLDFNSIQLEHCALPELSLTQIDTSTLFMGKRISLPLLISSTTGGTTYTHSVLKLLAEVAEQKKIALCVGSQRIALEFPESEKYFHLRDVAPTIPLLANLGAVQLNYGLDIEHCRRAIEMLDADGLVLHLNPLQECLQLNGNTDFRNLLKKIETLVDKIPVPLIVKEVGYGISLDVAQKLLDIGVFAIDLNGSGGTSFAKIESEIAESKEYQELAASFATWGLSTVSLLKEFRNWQHPRKMIIAGGGVRNGIDIAKTIQKQEVFFLNFEISIRLG